MIEEIKVKVNGKEEKVPIGTTLLQLSKNYSNKYRFLLLLLELIIHIENLVIVLMILVR